VTTPPTDATVDALGKLSAAFEVIEQARGMLYGFHRLTGRADFQLDDAVEALRAAGHGEWADRVEQELIGRNVIEGRWTYQLIEEYDDGYYAAFRDLDREARDALAGGERHGYEARLKDQRRTHGRRGHEATPAEVLPAEVLPERAP
jgi:hypothetical protein